MSVIEILMEVEMMMMNDDDDDDEELADSLFILKADAERGGSRIRRADPGGGPRPVGPG